MLLRNRFHHRVHGGARLRPALLALHSLRANHPRPFRQRIFGLVGLAMWLLGGGGAVVEGQETLTATAHIGGFVNALDLQDDALYVAQAETFHIFEVDGSHLRSTAFLTLDAEPGIVVVKDGKAYLGTEERLDIVGLGGSVAILGTLVADGAIQGIAIQDDIALLALDADGLVVLDVSDPQTPIVLASLVLTARDVAIDGDIAVVATDSGLAIIDLTDPANPRTVSVVDVDDQQHVHLADNHAFLFGSGGNGLQALDYSDPAVPIVVLDFAAGDTISKLDVVGERLFTARPGHADIFDVTDLAVPVLLGTFPIPFVTAFQADDTGDHLVIAPGGQLQVVDVSDPAAPAPGPLESPAFMADHVQHAGFLYIAADDGVWRYDISDPAAPVLVEHHPEFPGGSRIRAAGTTVHLIDQGNTLRCLGPGPEGALDELGALQLPITPQIAFEVTNDQGFVLGFDQLVIFDLSNPASPVVIRQVALGALGRDLAVFPGGTQVAVASTNFGPAGMLEIVDVDTGVVSTVAVPGVPEALAVIDDVVHVLTESADPARFAVHRLDVSNPASPIILVTVEGTGDPQDLVPLAGGRLAASFAEGGTFDEAPIAVGIEKSSGPGGSVQVLNASNGTITSVASLASSAPASISTVPSDPTGPLTVLCGFKSPTSQVVFSSKGITIILVGNRRPELTLSALGQPRLECPPEPGEEVQVASFSICTDTLSGWNLISLSLDGLGTGDEAADLEPEGAILRFAGRESKTNYSADNGTAVFDLDINLGISQCQLFNLSYLLNEPARHCSQEETKTFAVQASGADVSAIPLGFPNGEKKPIAPIVTAATELACVENETKNIGFPTVQPAILDADENDVIGVCPGVFNEVILVNEKGLTVRSKKGAPVTFLGPEVEIGCSAGAEGGADRVTITKDNVTLQDFTIRGARDGVVVQGKKATVKNNLIGGNSRHGVRTAGGGATDATIEKNEIGEPKTSVGTTQKTPRRNGGNGVVLQSRSSDQAEDNKIFGNCLNGVKVGEGTATGDGTGGNTLLSNTILGNRQDGVLVDKSNGNSIGLSGRGNTIAGNGGNGIAIAGETADTNSVAGNVIGLDPSGKARANLGHGIHVTGGADDTIVGGPIGVVPETCNGPCNTIAASGKDGVRVGEVGGSPAQHSGGVAILGNFIGTDAIGRVPAVAKSAVSDKVGNQIGVRLLFAETVAITRNLISGNRAQGVHVSGELIDPSVDDVSLLGSIEVLSNRIGTDRLGGAVLADQNGLKVGNAGSGIEIHGSLEDESRRLPPIIIETNLVSGNNVIRSEFGAGIVIDEMPGTGFIAEKVATIVNNMIGTDVLGEVALGNDQIGILVQKSGASLISRNLISGNTTGVRFQENDLFVGFGFHTFEENIVGLNVDKDALLSNETGVLIRGAGGPTIEGCFISGNTGDGIRIDGQMGTSSTPSDTNVTLVNNQIGVVVIDNEPQIDFGNGGAGVALVGARMNNIGEDDPLMEGDFSNLIFFNQTGIHLSKQSNQNRIVANFIAGNDTVGVLVDNSSGNNIGRRPAVAGTRVNLIRDNGTDALGAGIAIVETVVDAARNNLIFDNVIDGGRIPIDLGNDGPTTNDFVPTIDADDGGNGKLNFPVIATVVQGETTLKATGVLSAKVGLYQLDFYEGECQGNGSPGFLASFLGRESFTVVGDNPFDFIFDVEIDIDADVGSLTRNNVIALATSEDNNGTSELPICFPAGFLFLSQFETADTSEWDLEVPSAFD